VLKGKLIRLRVVRESDLPAMYEFHHDISNRGEFFPVGVMSLPAFESAYRESGFWGEKRGMLAIIGDRDQIIGHIEFFETVSYLDEIELSYQLYSREYDGRGIITEAVGLLTGYLFGRKKINRIRLIIAPGNAASKRVAEKSGYTFEGLARGAWWHAGKNHDVEVWSVLRAEWSKNR
jgi:ribosomal-protein-alanine N-acetyltransferase